MNLTYETIKSVNYIVCDDCQSLIIFCHRNKYGDLTVYFIKVYCTSQLYLLLRGDCYNLIFQHVPSYWVLLVGRVAGGMATSILLSAFESWVVCEHDKVLLGIFV